MSATTVAQSENQPTAPPPPHRIPLPSGLRGWMTFVGIMNILVGVFGILSCFGIITGVLTLIAGIAILGARSALDSVATIEATLWPFFDKFKLFVQMLGWSYLVGIIIGALILLFYGAVIFAAIAAQASQVS